METAQPRLPWSQRLCLAAVALLPFQWALTLNIGFPLKLSELALTLGIALHVFGRRKAPSTPVQTTLIALLILIVVASTVSALVGPPPIEVLRGFTRSLPQDTLLYCGYGLLVLAAWFPLRAVPRESLGRALVVASWLMGLATLLQSVLLAVGSTQILELLNFTTVGTGDAVFGSSNGVRSGPFLEGQHLGFVAGALFIVCVGRKAWLGMLWCAWCVLYSQSTTSFIGLAVAVAAVVLLRQSLKTALIVSGVGAVIAVFISRIPTIQEFVSFQLAKLGLFGLSANYDWATLSLDLRGIKTGVAFNMAMQNPLLGVGPGRYGVYFFQDNATRDMPDYYYDATHRAIAENAYAHVVSELGFVALALFAALFITLFIKSFSAPLHVTALVAFLGVGVASQSSWTFIPIWILIAYCSSSPRETAEDAPDSQDQDAPDSRAPSEQTTDPGPPPETTQGPAAPASQSSTIPALTLPDGFPRKPQ